MSGGLVFAIVYVAFVCVMAAALAYSGREPAEDFWTMLPPAPAECYPSDAVPLAYECAGCGRNAGHNAGCPNVRRHRAVRGGGES